MYHDCTPDFAAVIKVLRVLVKVIAAIPLCVCIIQTIVIFCKIFVT